MPRLAARLARAIANSADKEKYFAFPKKRRKRSLHEPEQILHHPSFNFREYTHSILLSDAETNPITHSRAYELHKSLPPAMSLPRGAKTGEGEKDGPREMREQERKWWSSPYRTSSIFNISLQLLKRSQMRMLSSPIRLCAETDQYLPSDLLIRLAYLRLPPSRLSIAAPFLAVVPDGLQHPKYTARKGGHGSHVLCSREAVNRMMDSGSYRRMARDSNVIPNSHLADQIAHLLRLRVLQEFERLGEQMQTHHRLPFQAEAPHTILRRLTRDELASIRSTGVIPYENAVAVLVLPPVNRNPITKQRPQGSMSAMPPEQASPQPTKPLPPLSVLMPAQSGFQTSSKHLPLGGLLPNKIVPFYNGLAAFPHPSQRAALHGLLARLLRLEGDRRYKHDFFKVPSHQSSSKHSHAFLLCSDEGTVKRADVAAAAIALWRLRMFEGGGWEDKFNPWSLGTDRDTWKLL